jgi:hypothetical protein
MLRARAMRGYGTARAQGHVWRAAGTARGGRPRVGRGTAGEGHAGAPRRGRGGGGGTQGRPWDSTIDGNRPPDHTSVKGGGREGEGSCCAGKENEREEGGGVRR